jgi:hypothetical protein
LGKAAAGETSRFPKDSKRRMHFSIVRFVGRGDGAEVLRGFFVVSLAQQVYIMCLCVTGRVPPTGGVFVYSYTPLTLPQKIKNQKTKNPAPKKPPSRKRDFPKINQPNFGIGGLVKTNKRQTRTDGLITTKR